MSVVLGNSEFGRALVKALGLEGHKIRAITLRSEVDEPVTVTVEKLVVAKEYGEVATLMKRYELIEADDEPGK